MACSSPADPVGNWAAAAGACNEVAVKHEVAELEGALLDAAVILANNSDGRPPYSYGERYQPSRRWEQAGPIIRHERIMLEPWTEEDGSQMCGDEPFWDRLGGAKDWFALVKGEDGGAFGRSPLIAAMRAYVASKFGDEVEM
jgi:hypothetical protein